MGVLRLTVNGPVAGYGPRGMVESWGPNQDVDVDDADPVAAAWANKVLAAGLAVRREDPPPPDPDEPPLRPIERAERAAAAAAAKAKATGKG